MGRFIAAFGGAWVLVIGVTWAGIELYLPLRGPSWFILYASGETAIEIGAGAAILLLIWWAGWHPERHRLVGASTIVLSLVSLYFPPAGLLIGPAAGAIGGALVIAVKPQSPSGAGTLSTF